MGYIDFPHKPSHSASFLHWIFLLSYPLFITLYISNYHINSRLGSLSFEYPGSAGAGPRHLSITNSRSSFRLTSIELVMPSSHLVLCCPLLLLSPIPPSIRVFSNESTFGTRWPKYWSFSFSISPSNANSSLQHVGCSSCNPHHCS